MSETFKTPLEVDYTAALDLFRKFRGEEKELAALRLRIERTGNELLKLLLGAWWIGRQRIDSRVRSAIPRDQQYLDELLSEIAGITRLEGALSMLLATLEANPGEV